MELEYNIEKKIGDYLITNKMLGRGASSEVKLGKNCLNQELYAVKIIPRPEECSPTIFDEDTLSEISILKNLSHENIVKLYHVFPSPKHIYMVFEYCNGKSLNEFIKEQDGLLSTEDIIGIFCQICNAFELLMKKNIMHRDIKPENIMFNNGVLKIVDFGYARIMENVDPSSYTCLGTPAYMCPQILKNERYSDKCDVWSTGILLFRMLTGEHPFLSPMVLKNPTNINTAYKILDFIMKTKIRWELFDNIKIPWIKDLVFKMLEIEEKNRFNWKQVIEIKNLILQNVGTITTNFKREQSLQGFFSFGKSSSNNDQMSVESNEDNCSFLINFLNYEKKNAFGFQKIAQYFFKLGKDKSIQIEETIGMVVFYFLRQMPLLLMKKLHILMSKHSLLRVYLLERKISAINVEETAKLPAYIKIIEEIECEMNKLEKINKDWEEKVIKSLQKKSVKTAFIQNFLVHLQKGSFQILELVEANLKEATIPFLDYYKKDFYLASNESLISFKLLKVACQFGDIFQWDFTNKNQSPDFHNYLENLKNMSKEELLKSILEN